MIELNRQQTYWKAYRYFSNHPKPFNKLNNKQNDSDCRIDRPSPFSIEEMLWPRLGFQVSLWWESPCNHHHGLSMIGHLFQILLRGFLFPTSLLDQQILTFLRYSKSKNIKGLESNPQFIKPGIISKITSTFSIQQFLIPKFFLLIHIISNCIKIAVLAE